MYQSWIKNIEQNIDNNNFDKYMASCHKNATEIRNNYPDYCNILYGIYNNDVNLKLNIFKFRAHMMNVKLELTDDKIMELFRGNCALCHHKDKLNEIAIIDYTVHYTKQNCITICQTCYYMKGLL